jgi:HSP20 family protein
MTHIKNIPGVLNLMDRFFQDELTNHTAYQPPVNIREEAEAYHLEIVAPGLNKHDFQVQINQQVLSVSYEKKPSTEENKEQFIRREFNLRSFKRTFTLSDKIETENIQATYQNGILSITLPKTAQKENKIKTLSIE